MGETGDNGTRRQILRATSISGGAAIVNIVASIARVKALALLAGPAGIGLLGLLQRLLTLAISLSSLGLGQSGGRNIAAASSDPAALAHTRRALFTASMTLGVLGLVVVWFGRESIATAVFGHTRNATDVGLMGIGVLLTAVTTSQTALLQGLRRIEDLARVTVISTTLGALLAVAIVWYAGVEGVAWMILATPLVGTIVALRYTARLPRPPKDIVTGLAQLGPRWRALAATGLAVFASGIVATVVQLEVRKAVLDELGIQSAGHFEAAWQVSMLYIGFVLAAMGTDYLPRLTTVIHDRDARQRLIDEQSEIALLLAAPVLVGLVHDNPRLVAWLTA